VQLSADQASDIRVQHKLRECLNQHSPDREELGIKVPVIAEIREGQNVCYVRLGSQFCVRDANIACTSLLSENFAARSSGQLIAS